jgi:hypothetical protein
MDEDRLALEHFLIENPDLERLEALLDEFNIFEALGAVNVELRHSEFLSFLMSPNQNHGLDDIFAKRFIQMAIKGVDPVELPFTAIDLDIWSLDDLEVRREWHNIDVLLVSDSYKLVVIIENKISSGEHGEQLQRYYREVERHFPDWKILGLFLTPEGDEPSDDRFLPLSYELVCSLVESIVQSRKSTLGPDIYTLMLHYTVILRRYILSGSEIEQLCQKIYKKHQRALDLIFEYRPDQQAELNEFIFNYIKDTPGIIMDHGGKTRIRFALEELETPLLLQGEGWTPSGRILLFEIRDMARVTKLYLYIGLGPLETRQKLFELSKGKYPPLKNVYKKLGKKYSTIYLLDLLTKRDHEQQEIDYLQEKFQKRWDYFTRVDLPKIVKIFRQQDWIWEEVK